MATIGILGAGHVGEALARLLRPTGHEVRVANSRGTASLAAFSRRTGARAVDSDDLPSEADVMILAIPMARVRALPDQFFRRLREGAIVVDACNYYPLRDGRIVEIDRGLAESAWMEGVIGRPVVKAFNNIIASRLATCARPAGSPDRIALPISGGDVASRGEIASLVEGMGFTPYDAGPMAESWRQQPGEPAYCTDPTIAELPALLGRASRVGAPRSRDRASKLLARLPSDYPADQLVKVSRLFVGLDRFDLTSWIAALRLGVALLPRPGASGARAA